MRGVLETHRLTICFLPVVVSPPLHCHSPRQTPGSGNHSRRHQHHHRILHQRFHQSHYHRQWWRSHLLASCPCCRYSRWIKTVGKDILHLEGNIHLLDPGLTITRFLSSVLACLFLPSASSESDLSNKTKCVLNNKFRLVHFIYLTLILQ